VGWAPLPPGVSLNVLSQLTFSGHPINPGFDFGLVPSSYVFIRTSRFLDPDFQIHVARSPHAAALFASSTAINNYSVVKNKIINGGINRGVVAAAVKRPVPEVALEPVSSAPDVSQSPPTLLASARIEESASASMQLPPLHYNAPSAAPVKHSYGREGGPGQFELPAFHGPDSPPPPYQSRAAGESRAAPPPPTRDVAASVSSSAKTTK
jgi:hypothetical protein